jgi:hypothetical protein
MTNSNESYPCLPPEFLEHYASGYEAQRLLHGSGQIEREPSLLGTSAHLLVVAHKAQS